MAAYTYQGDSEVRTQCKLTEGFILRTGTPQQPAPLRQQASGTHGLGSLARLGASPAGTCKLRSLLCDVSSAPIYIARKNVAIHLHIL